ncbi:MAG: zinc ribbon domain-containing protein [Bacillota bacterium]
MPTYSYRCEQCQQEFEVTCPMAERDRGYMCPVCGAPGRRQLATFSIKGRSSRGDSCGSCTTGSCSTCRH